jgi:hypothetical protein
MRGWSQGLGQRSAALAVSPSRVSAVRSGSRTSLPRPAPSEPDVTIARHPAQASAARYPIRPWGTGMPSSGYQLQVAQSACCRSAVNLFPSSGVRHTTPSRLGIVRPASCWVTRQIANRLADLKRTRSFGRLITCRPGRRGTVDLILQSPHGSLRRGPINVGPRRLLPLTGLFGLHRLTSPAIPSSARLPNRRDHGGSQPPFGLGISSSPRPYPPHYRTAFACSAAPLPPPPSPPLRSGYRRLAAAGRVGLILLSNGEKRMGRLRPLVRRVLVPPSPMSELDEPTRMPFWLRPISTLGRLQLTDLDNGRSLAFSHPSSARPPPDWCSQIVAVVPGASYVGLLLRMSE